MIGSLAACGVGVRVVLHTTISDEQACFFAGPVHVMHPSVLNLAVRVGSVHPVHRRAIDPADVVRYGRHTHTGRGAALTPAAPARNATVTAI